MRFGSGRVLCTECFGETDVAEGFSLIGVQFVQYAGVLDEKHLDVAGVGVVAVPDPWWGEHEIAFVPTDYSIAYFRPSGALDDKVD